MICENWVGCEKDRACCWVYCYTKILGICCIFMAWYWQQALDGRRGMYIIPASVFTYVRD